MLARGVAAVALVLWGVPGVGGEGVGGVGGSIRMRRSKAGNGVGVGARGYRYGGSALQQAAAALAAGRHNLCEAAGSGAQGLRAGGTFEASLCGRRGVQSQPLEPRSVERLLHTERRRV